MDDILHSYIQLQLSSILNLQSSSDDTDSEFTSEQDFRNSENQFNFAKLINRTIKSSIYLLSDTFTQVCTAFHSTIQFVSQNKDSFAVAQTQMAEVLKIINAVFFDGMPSCYHKL